MRETSALKKKEKDNAFINFISQKKNKVENKKYKRSLEDVFAARKRMERFLEVRGVTFLDDSKSQTINALWYSLECVSTEVVLIVKKIDSIELSDLKKLLDLKVKAVICIGDYGTIPFLKEPIYVVEDMKEAVHKSYELAEPGDAVLFSPVCKVNITKESTLFREAVREL